jgi:5S rRNA maturation endonuclease (ribonuclease M5)
VFQEKRKLPIDYIKKKKIGYYSQHAAFTIPIFDAYGNLVNIRFHNMSGPGKRGLRSKTTKLLYDITSFNKDAEEAWICEGEGDFWVLEGMLGLNAITTIGGAMVLPEVIQENIALFRDKRVILALDNDDPGNMASAKIRMILGTDNIHRIEWPENFPNKGDIRDFMTGV